MNLVPPVAATRVTPGGPIRAPAARSARQAARCRRGCAGQATPCRRARAGQADPGPGAGVAPGRPPPCHRGRRGQATSLPLPGKPPHCPRRAGRPLLLGSGQGWLSREGGGPGGVGVAAVRLPARCARRRLSPGRDGRARAGTPSPGRQARPGRPPLPQSPPGARRPLWDGDALAGPAPGARVGTVTRSPARRPPPTLGRGALGATLINLGYRGRRRARQAGRGRRDHPPGDDAAGRTAGRLWAVDAEVLC
jgi:hypothetical protein